MLNMMNLNNEPLRRRSCGWEIFALDKSKSVTLKYIASVRLRKLLCPPGFPLLNCSCGTCVGRLRNSLMKFAELPDWPTRQSGNNI
jgi:hypothetical protein